MRLTPPRTMNPCPPPAPTSAPLRPAPPTPAPSLFNICGRLRYVWLAGIAKCKTCGRLRHARMVGWSQLDQLENLWHSAACPLDRYTVAPLYWWERGMG